MLGNLLADAARWRVRLPRPAAEIEALVAARADALDAVAAPRLVHFDLWDGNVFVDGASGGARLSGLIDGERAFWGDPLFELASLALFGEIEDDEAFLLGYAEERGAPLRFDEGVRTRIALAQLYLYLIMWIEPAPRAFGPVKRAATRLYVGRFLRRALRGLQRGA
jgi:aminoglycoside phosphotransferase (APT) family kinase protein